MVLISFWLARRLNTLKFSFFFFAFQRIVSCCRPASNWGPYLERHRGERYKNMVDPKKETDHEIPTVSGSRKPE